MRELRNATVEELARVPGMNRALAEKVLNGHS
jgi:excinuclease UvrABC nuclease subunit